MTGVIGTAQLLEISAELKAEIFPFAIFFGMFFVVFGLGGLVVRHLPRKPGSMLDEILSEKWDSEEPEEETKTLERKPEELQPTEAAQSDRTEE